MRMRKAGVIKTGLLCFLALLSCGNHRMEKQFFTGSPKTRNQRLRQYSLDDQYKIFRYGVDSIEPPLLDLADPIVERGPAAVPFLLNQLALARNDIAVRDALQVFGDMAATKSYDVRSDQAVMKALEGKVNAMKDDQWRSICLKMLGRIKEPR